MPCLPGYRYCGPSCTGPGPPVNQLDVFCMHHDACYRSQTPNKDCDSYFLNNLQPYTHRKDKIGRDASLMYRTIKLKQIFTF